ncbi:MAG: hypothetical protein V4664_00925 [Patescibacteria group bacterium]
MGNISVSIVIFGVTGDLARNKLIPSLFDLYCKGELKGNFTIVGYGRKQFSAEEFSSLVSDALMSKISPSNVKLKTNALRQRQRFISLCAYVQGELAETRGYDQLRKMVKGRRVIYFLAIHPELHEVVIAQLGKASLFNRRSQVLIEKPFGHDIKSARSLDTKMRRFIKEDQIYRIDHYLGKSALLQLLRRRREDKDFERALEKDIKEVSVSLWETKIINKRGAFYDRVGALKDVGQNHLLQMLAVVIAPKEVTSREAERVQQARATVLDSLRLTLPTTHAQYRSYHDEPGVAPHSQTETFFSVTAFSSIPKHKKVLLRLSAGKGLSESKAEIQIFFKKPVLLKEGLKTGMVFSLNGSDKERSKKKIEAYEHIFLSALKRDQSVFCSLEESVAGWKFESNVRKFWKNHDIRLGYYNIGDPIHISKDKRT